jgi:pseudouridine synthase
VTVNGRVVTELGTKASPSRDRITVDGKPIQLAQDLVYLILHKPVGVVTTMSDPQGRPSIGTMIAGMRPRVYPIGRLDFHSAGLLLLSNDGELALRLTHPRYGIRKTYRVKVKGDINTESLDVLRQGVPLSDGRTQPAFVRVAERSERKAWIEITIAEGKHRQVRRMCEHVGLSVEKLVRTRLGPITLGNLLPSNFRQLTSDEVAKLRRAVGLSSTSFAHKPHRGTAHAGAGVPPRRSPRS